AGRAERRRALARLNPAVLAAMPLWVGSLADVEELLPPEAGLFDLVVVDNASSLHQACAVGALVRARRVVLAGDPRRLTPVAPVTAERVATVLDRHGLGDDGHLRDLLDPRSPNLFDAAARAARVVVLDEQVRSGPHLVERAAAAVDDRTVRPAAWAPSRHDFDAVSTVRLHANRAPDGVVGAEVDWVVGQIHRLRPLGVGRVGVVSPFPAQAAAIEAAVLDRFGLADIGALGLRVGTVDAAQDHEHDLILISLGIGADDDGEAWRFVEDARRFTAMTTRARSRVVLVCSAEPPPNGRIARYLAVDDGVPPVPASVPVGPWATRVADRLRGDGLEVITG
ncbi:MAG: AAA domain-containing protein, partial [Acidimicrobiales bacterium]